jgi:hypothetical protein
MSEVKVAPDHKRNGGFILYSGEHPFTLRLRVRPVGTLEFEEATLKLLEFFVPAYCDDLISLLAKAKEVAEDMRASRRQPG